MQLNKVSCLVVSRGKMSGCHFDFILSSKVKRLFPLFHVVLNVTLSSSFYYCASFFQHAAQKHFSIEENLQHTSNLLQTVFCQTEIFDEMPGSRGLDLMINDVLHVVDSALMTLHPSRWRERSKLS